MLELESALEFEAALEEEFFAALTARRGRANALPRKRLEIRADFDALLQRASSASRSLPRVAPFAAPDAAESQFAERISAVLRHARVARRRSFLLRSVRLAARRGRICRRLPRSFQDSPLPDQDSARPELSGLHLFRDENVPGPVLRRLHERGIRR